MRMMDDLYEYLSYSFEVIPYHDVAILIVVMLLPPLFWLFVVDGKKKNDDINNLHYNSMANIIFNSGSNPLLSNNESIQYDATTIKSSSSQQQNQEQQTNIVRPPEPLLSLRVGGESWKPFPNILPLSIIRVATDPDIFVIRNFITSPSQDCQCIIEYAKKTKGGLKYAKTTNGKERGRKHSYLCWIKSSAAAAASGDEKDDEKQQNLSSSNAQELAQDWTALAYTLFVQQQQSSSQSQADDDDSNDVTCEDLQILKYKKHGKYELHHDGLGRVVTCLTYLNGVAGTWFPFARIFEDDDGKATTTTTTGGQEHKLVPGQHGLWLAGSEADRDRLESAQENHVRIIQPGDAVVFYNYIVNGNTIVENQRAEHAGMETNREKWIATNWFRSSLIPDSQCWTDEDWRRHQQQQHNHQKQHLDEFKKNGFAIYPGLLKDDLGEILQIANEMAHVAQQEAGASISGHWNEGGFLFDDQPRGAERLYKVQGCALVNDKVKAKIFCNRKVVSEVLKFLPAEGKDGLDYFGTKFYPMFPKGGRSVGWHQDSHYFGTRNCPNIISAAVYLEDTSVENGCLRVMPGTHSMGIEYKHMPGHAEWKQGEWIDIEAEFGLDGEKVIATDVVVPAGTVVLFDSRLVHGAHTNESADKTRMSFFAHYCPGSLEFEWHGTNFSRDVYPDRHQVIL